LSGRGTGERILLQEEKKGDLLELERAARTSLVRRKLKQLNDKKKKKKKKTRGRDGLVEDATSDTLRSASQKIGRICPCGVRDSFNKSSERGKKSNASGSTIGERRGETF